MTHLPQFNVDKNRRLRIFVCICFALALTAAVITAQAGAREPEQTLETLQTLDVPQGQITLRRGVEPSAPKGFEPFTLTLETAGPKGLKVDDDDFSGSYGDFNVAFLDEERQNGDATDVIIRRWTLYPTKRGELILPPVPLQASLAGADNQAVPVSLLAPSLKLSVPESDAPLKSVDEIQPDLTSIRQTPWVPLLSVGVILALLFIIGLFLRRKKDALHSVAIPREPPYEKAIRRLNELKDSRTYLENKPEFYVEIDAILREFIAGAFYVNAGEKTTHELLEILTVNDGTSQDSLSEHPILADAAQDCRPTNGEKIQIAVGVLKEPTIRSRLEKALAALDLIKFAKRPTTFDDASEIYSGTRSVVEESFALYENRLKEFQRRLEAAAQEAQTGTGVTAQ